MHYKFEFEDGLVIVRDSVIKKIVIECITGFEGKIRLSNPKGQMTGLVAGIVGFDDTGHITVAKGAGGIDIKLYIVIKFGTSIALVTEMLIESIRQKVKDITDLEANSISIVVAGMQAKNIARRNIEVKG